LFSGRGDRLDDPETILALPRQPILMTIDAGRVEAIGAGTEAGHCRVVHQDDEGKARPVQQIFPACRSIWDAICPGQC